MRGSYQLPGMYDNLFTTATSSGKHKLQQWLPN